jgi:hypothetical protein
MVFNVKVKHLFHSTVIHKWSKFFKVYLGNKFRLDTSHDQPLCFKSFQFTESNASKNFKVFSESS